MDQLWIAIPLKLEINWVEEAQKKNTILYEVRKYSQITTEKKFGSGQNQFVFSSFFSSFL